MEFTKIYVLVFPTTTGLRPCAIEFVGIVSTVHLKINPHIYEERDSFSMLVLCQDGFSLTWNCRADWPCLKVKEIVFGIGCQRFQIYELLSPNVAL